LWRASPLTRSIGAFNARHAYGSIQEGDPRACEGWQAFESLAGSAHRDAVVGRIARDTSAPVGVAATYTFRYALATPLQFAGYLFAKERRVPRLAGNVGLRDHEYLQHAALFAPTAHVLPDDELAVVPGCDVADGEHALADALFAEVSALTRDIIDSWSNDRLLARANAWGGIIDALASGVRLAAMHAIDADAAWKRWDNALAGRELPIRRRPRRFQFECDGEPGELVVRADCCLWFTLPAAKTRGQDYCTSCYLTDDETRRARMVAFTRSQRQRTASAGTEASTEGA